MIHARNAVLQESVASTLAHYKFPMAQRPLHNAARDMATTEKGITDFKSEMVAVVGAKLKSEDRRSLRRRYWHNHKDFLKEEIDTELMTEFNTTDWAVVSAEQNEARQKEWTAAKQKCVKEQADLVKATHTVVDFVGNVEMSVWGDENTQSVGGYAAEL
jgi:hypothetical protein